MRVTIFIRIIGKINSNELWELIEHFGDINVTDCDNYTLVYGECYLETMSRIVYHCALYGDIVAEISHRNWKGAL